MTARLSIVMPVFNHPEELKTMLDSILANTYQDWELLAVDDGSEQETLALLDQYAAADSRIKAIRRDRQPKGAQTCRNIGMELAKGEFIIFFDSDDYIAPYCLEQRVKSLESRPELDFMVFRNGLYENDKFHTESSRSCYGYPIYADDVEAFCSRTLPYIVWNNIYRTEALRKHHITWDEKLLSLQDGDFNLQTLLADLRHDYAVTPPDYGYRIVGNAGSISKKRSSTAHLNSHLYSVDKNYRAVQEKFGNKYNRALYLGALYIFIMAFATKSHHEQALRLASIVGRHSPGYGLLFSAKIKLHHLLCHICPDSLAKKIAVADYSVMSRFRQWQGDKRRKQSEEALAYIR